MSSTEKNHHLTEEIIRELKLFSQTGPTLLGWIYGILHYKADSTPFYAAVQNGLLSLSFLVLYGFFYIMNIFFHFPSEKYLIIIESIITLVYLAATLATYMVYRKNREIPGIKLIQTLLDRVFQTNN